MVEREKITIVCKNCGKQFQCKTPTAQGFYTVDCPSLECHQKISFHYSDKKVKDLTECQSNYKLGLLENGDYQFQCRNAACLQYVLVPAKLVKIGHNVQRCPKCGTEYEFDRYPTETELLKCLSAGCGGKLVKPEIENGIHYSSCMKCGQKYSLLVQNGHVVKTTIITPRPLKSPKQYPMKLVCGSLIRKKEYFLTKGFHYIGRTDPFNNSDFSINDKFASSRSLRIDVNEDSGQLVYRLTVERATNPVYHNSREISAGDVLYLTYGDTLKIGKTLIKVQKVIK